MKKQLLHLFFVSLLSVVGIAQTSNPVCGGTFTDSGGSGNYPNNANETTTICPENPGDIVTITFSLFNTEPNFDALYVFDGNSILSPQFSSGNGPGNVPGGLSGGFWGTALPGPFIATSPDGCLTFLFRTDSVVDNPGWIANVNCIAASACIQPSGVQTSIATSNSVTLDWSSYSTSNSWQVYATPCGTPAPTSSSQGVSATAHPFVRTGLSPDTCYDFYVRSSCDDNVFSDWSAPITAYTTAAPPTCGSTFTDPGGQSANYPNGNNTVTTICPDVPGEKVRVTFTSFSTEDSWDPLYVFNGSTTSAPQILSGNGPGNAPGGLSGGFWGTTLPGPFESSSADGCLTFQFRSDSAVNYAGWIANVTCGVGVDCQPPSNPVVSNITATSATLNWTPNGSSTQWSIQYNGQTVTVDSPSYTITGLFASTLYTVSISSICEDLVFPGLAIPASFVTLTPTSNPLSVNTTLYDASGLVNNVLIDNPCLEVSNITSSTGTNFASTNGIGFFQNTNPTFPLTSGIVLSTGNADNIPGPNTSALSDGGIGWPGDTQLETIISAAIGTPMTSLNATSLEFDFTALNAFMSFNFLFASDEYGTFQCSFADAFAFLLTDLETGITTNIAVVPGTQDPVSVVTIRDGEYNTNCASVNEGYFDTYFGMPNYDSATNFIGQTSVMTASATVIPNHPYHIKLVVADRSDSQYDSAVFIEAGSFTSGPPQCSDRLQLVAFVDENANGVKDSDEDYFTHGSFSVDKNNLADPEQVYSPFGSHDLYDENSVNVYDLSFEIQSDYAAYYSVSASYDDLSVATGSGTQIVNFPITLTTPYNDVAVSIVAMSQPRPGLTYQNIVYYTNNGIAPASGTLTFAKDALVSITAISQAGTVANSNGFTFAFADLLPNETRQIVVTLSVPDPPIVNMDDVLTNTVSVSGVSNDIDATNNTFSNAQVVINSYDPNMVVEAHGAQIDINTFSANEYLYYTIYFQNIGTASAIQVVVQDVLDSKLNENTVVMMNSSHTYTMYRKGNLVRWNFEYIMLPGQLENDALSKGFIFFKVKVKPGFVTGDVIPNTAEIVFDSNLAIVTNTFYTTFVDALSAGEFGSSNVTLFPNPAKSSFTVNIVETNETLSRISVHDLLGKKVLNAQVNNLTQTDVDISSLSSGIYLVEITTSNDKKLVRKLVVE
ncbi:choice-of-anchor L domain-containing protein [Flavobacterium sp.]|uniref:choice-of-anchor L domain-containing protein n=1 Tax=Flavobacterium sp. TaxID=239 RepID=UPI00120D85AE|nr:choice-of-anchor L domain-containing protein [Flavobacterium sp.]RZJ71577.1 MAG: T9SS type A sorting domain-containing protein [Flavobacterium sp.]